MIRNKSDYQCHSLDLEIAYLLLNLILNYCFAFSYMTDGQSLYHSNKIKNK